MELRKQIPAIILAIMLTGCDFSTITSATPDTNTAIYLNPGDLQDFAVTVENGEYERTDESWNITNNNASSTQYDEYFNLAEHGYSFTTQYQPDQESPGSYRVRFTRTDYYTIMRLGEGSIGFPVNTTSKTWDVIVKGIEVLPETNIAMPGESETYEATAYPEGTYAYTWFLDDVQVATGKQFAFTLTQAQSGLHTLKVTATGSGGNFTYSRRLIVPTARIDVQDGWNDNDFSPGSDGNYYMAGSLTTEVDGNIAVDIDGQVSRLDGQGQVLWSTLCGGDGYDFLLSVNPTTDGGCIAAGLSSSPSLGDTVNSGSDDGYAVKLGSTGTIMWQKLIGTAGTDGIQSIRQANDGGFIAMGASDAVLWVVKLNASGNLVWQRTIEGARYYGGTAYFNDYPGVIIESAGAYLVAGGCTICKLNQSDGSTIWQVSSEVSDIRDFVQAVDGGYVYAGSPFEDSSHSVKLDDSGTVVWRQAYTSETDSSFAYTIAADAGGGFVLAGRFATQAHVDIHSVISEVKNHAMVMVLDKDGALIRRILFKDIHSSFNEILRIWRMTNGKYMALYEADGLLYLVPVDIKKD